MNAAHVQLAESFRLLLPEILLAVFFLIALLLDAGGRSRRVLVGSWTMLGFALAGVLALMQLSVTDARSPGVWIFRAAGAPYGTGMLVVDRFAIYFKVLIAVTGVIISFVSLRSEELIDEGGPRIGEYFALMLAMGFGMFLMVGASDLLTAYMSVEIVSLASYAAVCTTGSALRSTEASMKYLIHGAVSTGIMLFGISLVYGLIGSTSFSTILGELGRRNAEIYLLAPVLLSAVMILAGLGYKVAAVPFHFWAPDVYEGAPVTLTSFLAVASKGAGLALLIRFVIGAYPITLKVFNWGPIIAVVAAATMTLGNLAALQQGNLKRLLAYCTIAQGGMMLAGLAAGSAYGISAILIWLPVYLVTTLGAFFAVQKIAEQIGSEEIEDYRGLGRRMPAAGVPLGIFLIAMIGLPPTAGFISRLFLFNALVDAGEGMIWLAVVAALNSVIALYYYLRVLKVMYLERSSDESYTLSLDRGSTVILGVLAVALVLFGLPPLFGPLVEAAQGSLGTLVRILR
jgi:NADH-quinone oxidoreductase subunit N